jgi:hypothetical protein
MAVAEETGRRGVLPADQDEPVGGVALSAKRRVDKVAFYVRFSSHVAVWACALVPALLVLVRGWRPLGDYAAIELRAYRTLSLHPPLVGMFSTAGWGVGRRVFDPGPLSFWMLAAPVRIDPSHGLIWGSVLLWGLVLSLAIEAMWSSGYWIGCALIALGVIDLLWLAPSVLENLAWNAYLPLPFLFAAMVTAFVVARGGFGWWPVLVFTASVAAQTHLLYLLPSVGLVLIAPILGLKAGRPKRFRWLATGLGVAVLCWIAPLIQGLGANSNVTALARGTGGIPTLGFGFGFRLLGDSAGAVPIWLHHAPTRFYPEMAFAFSHQPAYGIVALSIIISVTAFAAFTGRRGLFAAGAVTVVTTSAFLVSFAMIPTANLIVVGYLLAAVWVEGFLIWILVIWCLLSVSRSLTATVTQRRNSGLRGSSLPGGVPPNWATTPAVAGCGAALIALMAGGSSVAIASTVPANANFGTNWSPQEAAEVASIVSVVEHNTAPGDVNVTLDDVVTDRLRSIAIGEGVGLQLFLDGWHPGLRGIDPALTSLPPIPHSVDVLIRINGNTIEGVEIQR